MYEVVDPDGDHLVDTGADVLGCVVRRAVVGIADVIARMVDWIAYVLLQVIGNAEPTALPS
ncbi:hypothetical protein ACWEQP_01780 [Streptomyces sp. NPDC004044]